MRETREIILRELRAGKYTTVEGFMKLTGVSKSRVRGHISTLRSEGFRISHCHYDGYYLEAKESHSQVRKGTITDDLRQIFKHGDEWSNIELSGLLNISPSRVSKALSRMARNGENFKRRKCKENNTTIWWLMPSL